MREEGLKYFGNGDLQIDWSFLGRLAGIERIETFNYRRFLMASTGIGRVVKVKA